MRIVKVRIRRGDHRKGEDAMVYPKRYDPVEVDRYGHYATKLGHPGVTMSGGIGRGEPEEWCLIMLPDALAQEYAQDPDMEIIDDATAEALMAQWKQDNEVPDEVVTDPARIEAIKAKAAAGIPLSIEDRKALDPADHTTPGVEKTLKPMAEIRRKLVKKQPIRTI